MNPLRLGVSLLLLVLVVAPAALAAEGSICTPTDDGQIRCTIEKVSDCEKVLDLPYARNLHCPSAFTAVRLMAGRLAEKMGVPGPTRKIFYFFQTPASPDGPPDGMAQTTVACLDTPAPYPGGSSVVVGAGTPLCHLVAYATSAAAVGPQSPIYAGNPVPAPLRSFPSYFRKLFDPLRSHPLAQFRTGSVFDPLVASLGANADDHFRIDYPQFSPAALYDPSGWQADVNYSGISGGGGGGWGGEIAILTPSGTRVNLLSFGGGGGGGMTSSRKIVDGAPTIKSRLGAGGGGGMEFANGYRYAGKFYTGLGLSADFGTDQSEVQYTYTDYAGSPRPAVPVHEYNPGVIADYTQQLENLHLQLRGRLRRGNTIVLSGGGGGGAGTEYLEADGQEYEPTALSINSSFLYSFEFETPLRSSAALLEDPPSAEQEDVYSHLGDDFRIANRFAYEACGSDYANYDCMCPKMHAKVLCLLAAQIGDPTKIPAWLEEPHCAQPALLQSASSQPDERGLSAYQQLLLDSASDDDCAGAALEYFQSVNTPVNVRY